MSNGTSVTVPAGALASAQTITITPSPPTPALAGATAVGSGYVFGPEGVTFLQPVTVTLAYDPKLIPAGKSVSDVKVSTSPVGSTAFISLPTSQVDATHVAAPTTHFSYFLPCLFCENGGGVGGLVPPPVPSAPCERPVPGGPPPAPCRDTCPFGAGSGGTKDIKAVCWGTRMNDPCECSEANPVGDLVRQPLAQGGNCASTCALLPECPALQDIGSSIREFYNLAALPRPRRGFGSLMIAMGPDQAQLTWVAWLLGHFYFDGQGKAWRDATDSTFMDIKIGSGTKGEGAEYADFEPSVAMKGAIPKEPASDMPAKPTMFVSPDCFFNTSPAELLSSLGHETIHYLQNLRTPALGSNADRSPRLMRNLPLLVQLAIQDMRELEAWTWEYGGEVPRYKGYKDGKDPVLTCLSDQEKAEIKMRVERCYGPKVQKRIWAICEGNPSCLQRSTYLPDLMTWLHQDPFGTIWLSRNSGFLAAVARPGYVPPNIPAECN